MLPTPSDHWVVMQHLLRLLTLQNKHPRPLEKSLTHGDLPQLHRSPFRQTQTMRRYPSGVREVHLLFSRLWPVKHDKHNPA